MNITYLIGNGFDLGIGLKTGFTDFLKHYVELPSSSDVIEKFKNEIKGKNKTNNESELTDDEDIKSEEEKKEASIKLWSDFERKFGEYISTFTEENIDDYIKLYEDVLKELNKYISEQNSCFSDEFSEEDFNRITKWLRLSPAQDIGFRPEVDSLFNNVTEYRKTNVECSYNFVSFNYTSTLDQILSKINSKNNGILIKFDNKYYRRIGKLIHIHGTLNANMLMGVNDESQLPFNGVLPDRVKRRIIKPVKNVKIGYQIDEQAKKMLFDSRIICIYGMSLGETDGIWWERIGKWISADKGRLLIFFTRNNNIILDEVFSIDNLIDEEEKCIDNLLDTLKISEGNRSDVRNRIIVLVNSEFMQIKMTKEPSLLSE